MRPFMQIWKINLATLINMLRHLQKMSYVRLYGIFQKYYTFICMSAVGLTKHTGAWKGWLSRIHTDTGML